MVKKTKKEMIKDVDRLHEIADEIFSIANTYAGDETGYIAISLHSIHNNLGHRMSNISDEITMHDMDDETEDES